MQKRRRTCLAIVLQGRLLAVGPAVFLSVGLDNCMSASLSFRLSVRASVCISACLYGCVSVRPSVVRRSVTHELSVGPPDHLSVSRSSCGRTIGPRILCEFSGSPGQFTTRCRKNEQVQVIVRAREKRSIMSVQKGGTVPWAAL